MKEDKKFPKVGVGVMIFKDDKVLLGYRHRDPRKADSELQGEGTWTMPGGKLDYKEDLKDCAQREVFEETGIKINKEKIKIISVTNDTVTDAHFITIGFLCEDFEGDAKIMEPDEITEWEWFDLNNLPSPIFFPSGTILKKFLRDKN